MGRYDVYVICSECLDVHLVSTGITLEDGPKEKQSIASAYAEKRPPPRYRNSIEKWPPMSRNRQDICSRGH